MSLATICQTALQENGDFDVPSSFIGNSNPTAVQLLALARRSLKVIGLDYRWQALIATHTFSTADGTETYALPTDFHAFAALTFWDRSNYLRMQGPVTNQLWEAIKSGQQVSAGISKFFRIAGNLFYIYPVPGAIETIAYQYYSNYLVTGNKTTFTDDGDTALVDEDLLTLGVRWRFLAAKGAPYAAVLAEYQDRLDALQARDGGRNMIDYLGPRFEMDNIPETGVGA